ncbi:hypothetical protein C8J56DRAFT_1058508 [Mycena floridula]|nr:hypothetical protein C8J56DRAFT_1058508 [Mycena floridula]
MSTVPTDSEQVSGTKRDFDTLTNSLPTKPTTKRGRKKAKTAAPTSTNIDVYDQAGKWITRGVDAFVNISSVFSCAVLPDSFPQEDKDRYNAVYQEFCKIVPGFTGLFDEFAATGFDHRWDALVSKISEAASTARSNDANGLKHNLNYVLVSPTTEALMPPIPKSTSKSDRGFNHPMLAKLLVPHKMRNRLENEEGFLQKLQDGSAKVSSRDWPSMFYPDNLAYNRDDVLTGLFKGHYPLRCARHILTGPASALRPTAGFSDASYCNANRGRVKMVTPGFVAYSCIQALFTISTVSSWDWIANDAYQYADLFRRIVQFLEDSDDDWATETLAHWQSFLFGSATTDEPEEPKTDDEDVDDMILAQRQKETRRRAREEAAAALANHILFKRLHDQLGYDNDNARNSVFDLAFFLLSHLYQTSLYRTITVIQVIKRIVSYRTLSVMKQTHSLVSQCLCYQTHSLN